METWNELCGKDPQTFSWQTLRDYMSLLKLHLNFCIKTKNYIEANEVTKKIEELQKIEKSKIIDEMNQTLELSQMKFFEEMQIKRDRIEEQKENEKMMLEKKIETLIGEFNNRQVKEMNNFVIGFQKAFPKETKYRDLEVTYKKEIEKCVKAKNFLRADELENEIKLQKEKIYEQHINERELQINLGIERIRKIHEKERKEFEVKIRKWTDDNEKRISNIYSKKLKELDQKVIDKNKEINMERHNYEKIANDPSNKTGLLISQGMKEIAQRYLQNIKAQNLEVSERSDSVNDFFEN